MDNEQLFFISIVALVLHYLILLLIISKATASAKRNKILIAQVDLLIKIAKHQGVEDEELNEVVNQMNK